MSISPKDRTNKKSANSTREELAPGIYINTVIHEKPLEYLYTVENTFPEEMLFTFDFTGSKNIHIEGQSGSERSLIKEISIRPKSTSNVVTVRRVNIDINAKIALQTHWEFQEMDEDSIKVYEQSWDQSIQCLVPNQPPVTANDSREHIETISPQEGFLDVQFLPLMKYLYKLDESLEDDYDCKLLTYRRAGTFMKNISILTTPLNAADITMGLLPNCWLISTLACLTEITSAPPLISSLFPPECLSASARGVYKVKLFKNGIWQTVLLDDYIPCYLNGTPLYADTKTGKALWVILLEKAYAKLCGGYNRLASGSPYEALIDFTGAPTSCLHFDDAVVKEQIEMGSLWKLLCVYELKGYILTVSTGTESEVSTGLLSGHTFLIKALKTTASGVCLVQLHNPWRQFEWSGDWSHYSPLWTHAMKVELGGWDDDSLVWMSFHDLTNAKVFSCLNISMIRRVMDMVVPWNTASANFTFEYNKAAHTVKGELFTVHVEEDATVFLTLHQHDDHGAEEKPYIDLGVTVLRTAAGGVLELVGTSGISSERQNMVSVDLRKGVAYTIVPSSSGCKFLQLSSASDLAVVSRQVVVYVHSEAAVALAPSPYDAKLMDKAFELALLGGTATDIVEDAMQMYSLRGGNAGITFGALNSSKASIRLTTDFSAESVNVSSHRGKLVNSVVIAPGELKVLHHLCPTNEKLPWEAVWDCKVLFYDEVVKQETEEAKSPSPVNQEKPTLGVNERVTPRAASVPGAVEEDHVVAEAPIAPVKAGCSCVLM